jgi:hypothetical protein
MASNKEERERLRRQRLASQQSRGSSDRRRLILGYVVAGVLTLAVVAGLVAVIAGGNGGGAGESCPSGAHVQINSGVIDGNQCDAREGTPPPDIQFGDLQESATQAKCETHLDLPDEGNSHFTDETQGTYKTNPPTSGDHYGSPTETASGPMADGAYSTTPVASRVVHSMEHGRVEIRYSPDLPEDKQLALKGVFDESTDGVLIFPDPDMPYVVAVSAWRNYIGCKSYNPIFLDVIRNFRDTYRGNGPEPVPISVG